MNEEADVREKALEELSKRYSHYIGRKTTFLLICTMLLTVLAIFSIGVGAVSISVEEILQAFFNYDSSNSSHVIIMNVRLPRILMAIVAGAALAVAGAVMQCVLRNPLASPYTLGISQAAAFGAAFGIIFFGAGTLQSTSTSSVLINNPYIVTIFAFLWAMVATFVVVALTSLGKLSAEAMVLAGVAIASIFGAGIVVLQYIANTIQLSAMVYWTFGDLGRSTWTFLGILVVVTGAVLVYFFHERWDFNAMDAGEETAKGLGVNVSHVRIITMILASLLAAVVVSFMGIIGFIGLLAPHMVRRLIGADYRYLLPGSILIGSIVLLGSDTLARTMFAPQILPVGVITAFLGGPLFLYLLIRGGKR